MALKPRADITRNQKQRYQWSDKELMTYKNFNKEAIWLYAELFLGHHDGSCHGLW